MNPRTIAVTLAILVGLTVAAILAAVVAARVLPDIGILPSVVVAAVLAAATARSVLHGWIAFLLVALVADTAEHWGGMSLRLYDEAAIPLLILVTLAVHRSRIEIPRLGWREAGLALFLAAGVASALVNGVPVTVWGPAVALLGKGFAVFYLLLALRVTADELRPLALACAVIGAIVIGIGFVEFLAPEAVRSALGLPPYVGQRGGLTVVKSIFLHPALYGWLTAFGSLFLYARFAVLRSPIALVAAVILNIGTLLSGRRTPLLGVVVGLVLGAVRQVAAGLLSPRVWLPVAGALVLFAVVSLPVLGRFYERTLTEYGAPPEMVAEILSPQPDADVLRQMQPRIALYLGSLAIARDELPFGAGFGRFGSHMSREAYSPVYADYGMDGMYGIKPERPIAVTDTFWPMVLGEAGVFGLLGLLAFFGFLFRDLWHASGRIADAALRATILGALLVYVEALVRALTSSVFVAPPIAYVVFATAALALAVTRTTAVEVEGATA